MMRMLTDVDMSCFYVFLALNGMLSPVMVSGNSMMDLPAEFPPLVAT